MDSARTGSGADARSSDGASEPRAGGCVARAGNFYFAAAGAQRGGAFAIFAAAGQPRAGGADFRGGVARDKLIRPERAFRQEDLDHIADYLNHHYTGWTLEAMRADLRKQLDREREQYSRLADDALMLCDPSILGDNTDRKIYVEGAALIASSPDFTDQAQLRELAGSD